MIISIRSFSLRLGKYRSLQLKNIKKFCGIKINQEKMEELEEAKRPPYRCGSFISKQMKAEKTIKLFDSSRKSLDSILELFEEYKDDHADIPALLEAYRSIRKGFPTNSGEIRKFPLIVLEGLDGSGKSTVGMRLSKKLNAERVSTPPKSISHFREKFDGHPYLHAPFYYFGNYFAALEVEKILQEKPVVMDRFWHSTTAFALAQMKENYFDVMKSTALPERNNDVYEWPEDLLKPDIVILLDVCEEVRIQRLSRRTTMTAQEDLLASKAEFRKNVVPTPNIEKDAAVTFTLLGIECVKLILYKKYRDTHRGISSTLVNILNIGVLACLFYVIKLMTPVLKLEKLLAILLVMLASCEIFFGALQPWFKKKPYYT